MDSPYLIVAALQFLIFLPLFIIGQLILDDIHRQTLAIKTITESCAFISGFESFALMAKGNNSYSLEMLKETLVIMTEYGLLGLFPVHIVGVDFAYSVLASICLVAYSAGTALNGLLLMKIYKGAKRRGSRGDTVR